MDPSGENLAFIVASPRSGTTWLRRLIATHPKVRSGPESYIFARYVGPSLRRWYKEAKQEAPNPVGLSAYLSVEEFRAIVHRYAIDLLSAMAGDLKPGDLFLEKTPDHSLFLREITDVFPRCKVIHIIRDPRDAVASMIRTGRELGWNWVPRSSRGCAMLWAQHVEAVQRATPLIMKGHVMLIRYEDLVKEPCSVLAKTYDFLGLPYTQSDVERAVEMNQMDRARAGMGTATPVRGEASKRLGSEAQLLKKFVGKAGVGNWRTDLSPIEKFWVWYAAGRTMTSNGYEWDVPKWYYPARISVNFVRKVVLRTKKAAAAWEG